MMIFLIRLVLGAFAFIGHAAATDNVSAEYLSTLPFVINPNGVACQDELHITSARQCVVAAKRIKITKMKMNIHSKFLPPYGCSLKGKTVYFNRVKRTKSYSQKSVTSICRILSDCCTCDPDPSMNPSKRLSAEPSVEPSIFPTTVHPSEEPSLMHTVDPSTFTFNGSKKIEKTLNSKYYDGIIRQPPTDYILRFTVKPQGKSSVHSSIIHMTTGDNCCHYGTRVPAVFFKPESTSLYVVAGYNNKANGSYSTKQLDINTESDIEIRVVENLSTLLINGVVDYTRTIGDRSPILSNVKVYFGGPWNSAANAIISNVTFTPA